MRYAILADIHSNLEAFQAVLNDLEQRGGFDKIWCLGDIVGYGPNPHECIELLCQFEHICVAGNHDWAVVEKISLTDFNPYAVMACLWTNKQLYSKDIDYLINLPTMVIEGNFTLVHGSPRYATTEYLVSESTAAANFQHFETKYCLVGHSHIPLIFTYHNNTIGYIKFDEEQPLYLDNTRLIVNPGGVGQPRDYDPRASYALYNDEINTIQLFRVEYDIEMTQNKMIEVGLPEVLSTRLSYGW